MKWTHRSHARSTMLSASLSLDIHITITIQNTHTRSPDADLNSNCSSSSLARFYLANSGYVLFSLLLILVFLKLCKFTPLNNVSGFAPSPAPEPNSSFSSVQHFPPAHAPSLKYASDSERSGEWNCVSTFKCYFSFYKILVLLACIYIYM